MSCQVKTFVSTGVFTESWWENYEVYCTKEKAPRTPLKPVAVMSHMCCTIVTHTGGLHYYTTHNRESRWFNTKLILYITPTLINKRVNLLTYLTIQLTITLVIYSGLLSDLLANHSHLTTWLNVITLGWVVLVVNKCVNHLCYCFHWFYSLLHTTEINC